MIYFFTGLYDYPYVKRVEMKESDSGVLIYFDKLGRTEVCPTVAAYRVAKVAFQKPTAVKVYDYYDSCKFFTSIFLLVIKKWNIFQIEFITNTFFESTARQARQFYEASPASLCDICDLDECDPSRCEEQIIQLNRQQQVFIALYLVIIVKFYRCDK